MSWNWYAKWGGPLVVCAVGFGALAGATQWRYLGPGAASAPSNPVYTVTKTTTETAAPPPAETRVVRDTVTLTKAPETRVREVPAPPPITVVRTVSGDAPQPDTTTSTVTKTQEVLVADLRRGKGDN